MLASPVASNRPHLHRLRKPVGRMTTRLRGLHITVRSVPTRGSLRTYPRVLNRRIDFMRQTDEAVLRCLRQ